LRRVRCATQTRAGAGRSRPWWRQMRRTTRWLLPLVVVMWWPEWSGAQARDRTPLPGGLAREVVAPRVERADYGTRLAMGEAASSITRGNQEILARPWVVPAGAGEATECCEV
jgi:hypothetical protein